MQSTHANTSNLLLARMSQKGKEPDIAAEQYMKALSDDAWLWEAYTALCDLGTSLIPPVPVLTPAMSSRTEADAPGAPPLLEHMFPSPPTAVRTSSTATLRPSTNSGRSTAVQPSFATSAQAMAAMSARNGGPRESNPFGAGAGPAMSRHAGPRHAGPDRARSPPGAGTSRYGANGLNGGLMANMTPGTGYDDSMLGHSGAGGAGAGARAGAGAAAGAGTMGLFTPDVGAESVLAGRGGGLGGLPGQGGASRVQMLGGTLWE